MKQPELGLKVTELRQSKGLTQEQLAEHCEVSPRTIQRIESGEVDPRSFTLNALGTALGFDFNAGDLENETFWLALLHMSNMFIVVLIPLLIWSWLKEKSYAVDKHGRDVLNFQITMTLALFSCVAIIVASVPLGIFLDGNDFMMVAMMFGPIIPLMLVGMFATFQGAINTMRVLGDRPYRYPLSIKFVK